jgi:hypothetical protein
LPTAVIIPPRRRIPIELGSGGRIAETDLRIEVVAVRKAEVVRITIPTARGVDIVSPFMQ